MPVLGYIFTTNIDIESTINGVVCSYTHENTTSKKKKKRTPEKLVNGKWAFVVARMLMTGAWALKSNHEAEDYLLANVSDISNFSVILNVSSTMKKFYAMKKHLPMCNISGPKIVRWKRLGS